MDLNSKTEELPSGRDNTSEFSKVIEDSKQRVADEQTAKQPAKRGRGRPRKPDAGSQPQAGPSASASVPGVTPISGPTPVPDISPYIAAPLQALSIPFARKHGIQELALTDEEAALCAKSLNEVLKAFAPSMEQMSPKTAAVLGLAMTVGSIGFGKYQIILSHKPKTIDPAKAPEFQEQVAKAQEIVSIPADDYFRKVA